MLPRRIDMAEPWSITSAEVSSKAKTKNKKPNKSLVEIQCSMTDNTKINESIAQIKNFYPLDNQHFSISFF
ncbi:MAG: hypothetical protein WKG06_42695 [Segetibacter sp.]